MNRRRGHEVSVRLTLEELSVIVGPVAEQAEELRRLNDPRTKAAESAFLKINDQYRAWMLETGVSR